jgi:alpha-beta hydrolase superfamily lysophospholipase
MVSTRRTKKWLWILLGLFLLGNVIIYNHAYRFSHFSTTATTKTNRPEDLGFVAKVKTLFLGVEISRPVNSKFPQRAFKTIRIPGEETLEAWQIDVINPKGVVLLFHGYSASKSSLLTYAEELNNKGYTTLLVVFRGSGGSTGNVTTIGYKEAKDVQNVFIYADTAMAHLPITLFGCSMGAAAIMKSVAELDVKPRNMIIECPFGRFRTTTQKRFEAMGVPSFPFADLLMLYGGMQLGFNTYAHNPVQYAKNITVPTLLLFGQKDQRIPLASIQEIYSNLQGPKLMKVLPNSAHQNNITNDAQEWHAQVNGFLNQSY